MNEIWAIVLAAGESKRMETQKLLLPFDGNTIIGKVVENIISSEVKKIMVVLGSNLEEIHNALKNLPVSFCFNVDYKEGMHTSVYCGFRALPEHAAAALVFQGDQPFIPGEVTNKIINAWKRTQKGIVIPVSGGKRGHPTLFNMKYREEITQIDAAQGLRSIALTHPEDVLEVETDFTGITWDIDTKNDYLDALNQIKSNEYGRNNSF
jgi:molybdenum cofactor cytidylyltransferase